MWGGLPGSGVLDTASFLDPTDALLSLQVGYHVHRHEMRDPRPGAVSLVL